MQLCFSSSFKLKYTWQDIISKKNLADANITIKLQCFGVYIQY